MKILKKFLLPIILLAVVAIGPAALTNLGPQSTPVLASAGNSTLTATPVLLTGIVTGVQVNLWGYNSGNPNSTLCYLQFFDASSAAAVTLGTTAPAFWLAVPAFGGGLDTPLVNAYPFRQGIVVACTTTPTGNTAPSSACPTTIFYQ
jgi:hypothetical protein